MRRQRTILVGLVAACGSAVAGTLAARWANPPVAAVPVVAAPESELAIDPDRLDFGDAWESERFEWTIPIQNRSTSLVELTGLSGSCNCGSVEPSSLAIPPGESRSVHIAFDLRPRPGEKTDATARSFVSAFNGTLRKGSGRTISVSWKVRGRIKTAVRTVAAIDLGQRSELDRLHSSRVVPLEPVADIESLATTVSRPEFHIEIRRASESNRRWDMVVRPAVELKLGAYKGTVTITPTLRGGERLPSLQLPLSAEVVPDIEAIPPDILMGGREVGTTQTETITLRSLTNRPYTIERTEAKGEGVDVAVSEDRTLKVKVQVTEPGSREGQVRVVVRPDGSSPIEIVVPIRVHGFRPE